MKVRNTRGQSRREGGRRILALSVLMLGLAILSAHSVQAELFGNRATYQEYQAAVDEGTWCGKALQERRDVTTGGGSVLPQCDSQQHYCQNLKGWTADAAPAFVDDTKMAGGTFDSYFATFHTSNLPRLSNTVIGVDMWYRGRVPSPGFFSITPWRQLDSSPYGWSNMCYALGYLSIVQAAVQWTNCEAYSQCGAEGGYGDRYAGAYSNYVNDPGTCRVWGAGGDWGTGSGPYCTFAWGPIYEGYGHSMATISYGGCPCWTNPFYGTYAPGVDFYAAYICTNPVACINCFCYGDDEWQGPTPCGADNSYYPYAGAGYELSFHEGTYATNCATVLSMIGGCEQQYDCPCPPGSFEYEPPGPTWYSVGWATRAVLFAVRYNVPGGFQYEDVRQ